MLARACRVRNEQRGVERLVKLAIRRHGRQEVATIRAGDGAAELAGRGRQHVGQVHLVGLPVAGHLHLAQTLGVADHLVDGAEAQIGHDLAQLLGHERHEVHHVFGLAGEAAAQLAVLRSDAHRAGILLAIALHHAAHRHQRHSGEAELLGTEQGRHGHVAAAHELAVGLHDHAAAQAVAQKRLLGFRQADLERDARMVDGVARGRARAAIVAGDGDLVGAALRHARGDGAHARQRAQLHGHARIGVGVFQVEDELRQVLDGVDVVMRRRRDQAHARRGAANLGDPRVHLLAGQVAAFAGFCALSHLNLNLDGARQVAAGHAETARRHLLDGAALAVAVCQRRLARRVLATLTGVAAPTKAVHGDCQALVRFLGDGAVAHGAGVEALDDLARGFDLVQRHRLARRREVHEVAQRDRAPGHVARGAVLAEQVVVALAARALQQIDGLRVDQVLLAAKRAPRGDAERGKLLGRGALLQSQGAVVALVELALHAGGIQAADAGGGVREILLHQGIVQAQDLEDLRTVVALHRGDAHLRHDGGDTGHDGAVIVGHGLVAGNGDLAALAQVANALVRRIRVDARRGIAHQAGEIVRAHRVAGLDDQVGVGAQAHGDQVVMNGSQRQQAGDGHFAFRRAVGQHDQVHAIAHRLLDVDAQLGKRLLEHVLGGIAVISAHEALRLEADAINSAQAIELVVREHGAFQAHQAARVAAVLEHVAVVAHVQHAAGDEAFAQRVDRRVRDLGEQLVEVIEEAALALRQARQRGVGAHGCQGHLALLGHGAHQLLHVVVMVAQLRQTAREAHVRVALSGQFAGRRGLQIVNRQRLLVQPIAVRLLVGVTVANLVVPDDAALARVHLEHLAGAQAASLQHVGRVDVDGADLRRQDQPVVAGDVVARRAQAVAVKRGAEHAPVGERDGRRAVPRLHEHGLVCVVGAALVGDAVVVVPRLRDHHGDGAVERTAVHGQELQHVVQNGRVRTLTVDDRQHLSQVIA